MMRAKTENMVRRWKEQRWLMDSVIQAVGMEWDQPRLGYTMYPAGPDAVADFRTVGMRVRKSSPTCIANSAAAARRREIKAEAFERQGRLVSARESYFIAAMLYSAARWPIFENNEVSIDYNTRMVACYDKFAAFMNRPIERIEVPFGGEARCCPAICTCRTSRHRAKNSRSSSASTAWTAPRRSCARCMATSSSSAAWRNSSMTAPGRANAPSPACM